MYHGPGSRWWQVQYSCQGSAPSRASRPGTVRTVKRSGRRRADSSSQDNGVETGAPARARGE